MTKQQVFTVVVSKNPETGKWDRDGQEALNQVLAAGYKVVKLEKMTPGDSAGEAFAEIIVVEEQVRPYVGGVRTKSPRR